MSGNDRPQRKRATITYFDSDEDADLMNTTTQQPTTSSSRPSTSSSAASVQKPRNPQKNKKKITKTEAMKPVPTKFEKGSPDTKPRMLTPIDIEEIIRHRPVAILIASGGKTDFKRLGRLKIENAILATIPAGCHPANLAQKEGKVETSSSVIYPGIPNKFFGPDDVSKFENDQEMWKRQTLFEIPNDPENFNVKYVGFDSLTIWKEEIGDLEEEDPLLFHLMTVRNEFLLSIQQMGANSNFQKGLYRERFLEDGLMADYKHQFWKYQDLTYFHSMEQRNHGFPAVFYMCLHDESVDPPKFAYSTLNILSSEVLDACIKMEKQRRKALVRTKTWDRTNTPCETPHSCQCNRIFASYYKLHPEAPKDETWNRVNMVPNQNGLLDMTNYDPSLERILIECSDVCGCSINCPRRALQRGSTSELVVYYENETIRFGLRAARPIRQGELICEYTGQLLIMGNDSEASSSSSYHDSSYDCETRIFNPDMVVSSWKVGNVGRFVSHACTPNSAFMEVHSRFLESDPLIPRLAAFALVDIPIGGKISFRYYPVEMMTNVEGVPCQCAPGCKNTFPISS